MDRLQRAFVEFESSWKAIRDERASLDGPVAWMGDAVDEDLQRVVVSLEAAGIDLSRSLVEDSVPAVSANVDAGALSGNGDGAADRSRGHSCDCVRASEVLKSICRIRDVQHEVEAVFRRHDELAVTHLRHLHREASRKRLYFYVDFEMFVKLVQQGPVTDLDLVWHRQKFAEWVLIMPSSGHRGSGDNLRVTMEVPGLFVD